ncbi:hypothetical protein GobsT_12510 [Gemmata obscuriglobus]|uniref:Uncharacterized protein n=1 Tax=Gemmata obscuriglobus TaxID=114 RepID=A0A2Z3HBE1_9BACT|nr:hypothetical protein [Gemmata obscuriglobus]AWM40285.1 hypothetical protein C1280_26960 [Gemmata obscuriglobus]QEG26511.1 hypothetical protein GobsT_12510 [Gemmata obscuriglobus]VTS01821.1 unnamed protein product [Gemmata obscuriglobus UQM 2246]
MPAELVEVQVWVLVGEAGDYEVAKAADELQAAAGEATRLVKLVVKVPKPKAVELVATIADEPAGGELKGV